MSAFSDPADAPLLKHGRIARGLWLIVGLTLVGIGFVGLFVPLLPTTDFMLLAVPCFARSSPQLEAWLLNHKRFGAPIRAWRAERAVPTYAKVLACVGMAVGYGWFFVSVRPRLPGASGVAIVLIATALWLVFRPTPSSSSDEMQVEIDRRSHPGPVDQ